MSLLEFAYLLIEVGPLSGLPALIYYFFIKNKDANSNVVFFILLLSFTSDVCNHFFVRYIEQNGYIIENIWVILDFLLCCYFFSLLLGKIRKEILILVIVFAVATLISINYYSFRHPNPITSTLSSLGMLFFCILSFYNILKSEIAVPLRVNPLFWVLCGIFFFQASNLIQGVFLDYLIFELKIDKLNFVYLYIFSVVTNFLKNLFFFFFAFILVNKGYQIKIDKVKPVESW